MTNEERIKADAERYAGLMAWVNTSNDPDREPLFHEHISSASYIAGATAEHDRAKVLVDALEEAVKELGIKPAAGREDDAVAFAEWLYQNRWFQFENGKWYYTFEQGTSMSDKQYQKEYVKTTAELYELFKQQHNP